MIKRFALLAMLIVCLAVAMVVVALPATPTQATAASPVRLSLRLTCARATDYRSGEVCVHTQARAGLTITIRYCTGHIAVSRSLKGMHYANAQGNYTWTWEPETKCHGKAVATVQEHFKGHVLSASDAFTVK